MLGTVGTSFNVHLSEYIISVYSCSVLSVL